MTTLSDSNMTAGTEPECGELVQSIQTLLELGQDGQARAVMRVMRRCILQSDCVHALSCRATLRRLERRHAA